MKTLHHFFCPEGLATTGWQKAVREAKKRDQVIKIHNHLKDAVEDIYTCTCPVEGPEGEFDDRIARLHAAGFTEIVEKGQEDL